MKHYILTFKISIYLNINYIYNVPILQYTYYLNHDLNHDLNIVNCYIHDEISIS